MKWVHPWDPHPPSFSRLLPESIRPYPSFEGWFFRIVDSSKGMSFAVIIATNYATWESFATIVFCTDDGESPSIDGGKHGGRTHRVQGMSKDVRITSLSHLQDNNANSSEPLGFEWEAPELGKVIVKSNETNIDICVMGCHLKARLISKVHWDQSFSYKGPEGWARILPIMPTHWHVYSVGSEASYEFNNNNEVSINSQGWAHEEKNWGVTFPAGHVWLQAISDDNTAQITALADPDSFCEPILAPVGKLEWKPACRESYLANIMVEVYAHGVLGITNQ